MREIQVQTLNPETEDGTLWASQPIANSDKTQIPAFHLLHREANRSLKVSWNGVDLENTAQPKHLGVTFDRTLSCKQYIQNTKIKVATPNNLLKKLAQNGVQIQEQRH